MKTYTIKIDDDELWKKVKSKAALKGISIKNLIKELLKKWIENS